MKLGFLADIHEKVDMKPGDLVNIPSHKQHPVEWMTQDGPTLWLAVFCGKAS